ncbi:SufD family Fe-S cluster assembly protein [Candidatus Marsarchaeota archaeon]|nr:SufD family Fe-S cluster assembly protein [Candidatus Marsarchaeota archaeon]
MFEYNSGDAQNKITHLLHLGKNSKIKVDLFNYQKNTDSEIQYLTVMNADSKAIFNSIYAGGTNTVAKNIFYGDLNTTIEINGLVLGNGNQKFDIKSSIANCKNNSKNSIKYKAIMAENSVCLLKSISKVFKNAKNNAIRINHMGIINNNAKIHSMPFMIIKERDVDATHSSSIYKLDDDSKFYMESRGISKQNINRFILKEFAFSDLKREYANNYEFIEEKILKLIK